MIKRKPVAPHIDSGNGKAATIVADPNASDRSKRAEEPHHLGLPPSLDDPIEEGEVHPDLDEQLANLQLETDGPEGASGYADSAASSDSTVLEHIGQPSVAKHSKLKAAWGEVTHFAGGLISHPYEATRHYTVLRHSHGLVYYRGPTTSVAITVFSDQPLPPDRKLWLQKRGFSGKTGLKVGAYLGTRSAWIDVTPAIDTTSDLLPHSDERAWQRDIGRFIKKAEDAKHLRNHHPYETDIIRIPHAAEDGYFRIVLCAGRKVLCPSPIFRYVSASLDPSRLRGASLRTLPLELGIKIGANIASNAANAAAHGALQPATTMYQNNVQPVVERYNPMGLTQAAATAAYQESAAAVKMQDKIGATNERYDAQLDPSLPLAACGDAVAGAEAVGGVDAPQAPFPVTFSGKVTKRSGRSQRLLGIPTADLRGVPEDTLMCLAGVYCGWASISMTKILKASTFSSEAYDIWYPALITIAPARNRQAKVVEQKHISAYLVQDFGGAAFFDARLDVMLMAFLRPADPIVGNLTTDREKQQMQFAADIAIVQASLSRPSWAAEAVLERVKSEASSRSFTDRVADAGQAGRRQIDKVPVHLLGIRTNSIGLKDQLIGNGGLCVKR